MVRHQNRVVLVHEVRDQLPHLWRAGRAIRRNRNGRKDFILGNHARGRLDARDGEARAVRRMAMTRGDGPRLTLHDLQVHQDFAGAFLHAGKLVAFEIHEAHVLGFHETLAHERRRAERDVFAHANRDVAAVAIDISALPEPAADVAKLFLQRLAIRRIEKRFEFGFGTSSVAWAGALGHRCPDTPPAAPASPRRCRSSIPDRAGDRAQTE